MGKLIAVVEDEPFIAEVLEFLLAGVDRQVKLLRSGEEARRFFSHSQLTGEDTPALVVLDLMMPDDDGEAIYESMLKPGSGWIAGRPKTIVLSAVGQAPVKRAAAGIRCRSIYHEALFQRGAAGRSGSPLWLSQIPSVRFRNASGTGAERSQPLLSSFAL